MWPEGISTIGDGLLAVDDDRLKELLTHEDINDVYDVEQTPFARGKFATVRRAVHKKTGCHFAAKFLRRRRRAQCTLKEIGHEIAILMLCSESNHIVKLKSVHETRTETALLLELATGGDLQAILDEEGALTEIQTQICMREVLKAIEHMHQKCIAHLDLKPQNILLCGQNVEDGLKLCDFGISRVVEDGGKIREILGTPDYVAPEVLQYEPLSLKTDIWSIGVLAYVLLSGCSPFGGDSKQETFLNISQCDLTFPDELFDDISPAALDFIRCAIRLKAADRITASECLNHRWLREVGPEPNLSSLATSNYLDIIVVPSDRSTNGLITTSTLPNNCNDICSMNKSSKPDKENIIIINHNQKHSINHIYQNGSSNNCSTKSATNCLLNSSSNCSFININLDTRNLMNGSPSPSPSPPPLPTTQPPTIQPHRNSLSGTTVTINTTYDTVKHQTTASLTLFPDAPTTPKVCRKSSPDTSPNVKALVKKFQSPESSTQPPTSIENIICSEDDLTTGNSELRTHDGLTTDVGCTTNGCIMCQRHLNGSTIDQGIIC